MSPAQRVGLPYFEDYLKPDSDSRIFCIPLCDGIHFQGYIVDIDQNKIIHVDSLSTNNPNNQTSLKIANVFFKSNSVQYESLFITRRQFDSNSCGVWLVSGVASLVLNLPIPSTKQEAFEIAYSLIEYENDDPVQPKIVSLLPLLDTESIVKIYSSAEFLINALLKEPTKSEHFKEKPVKGMRNNYFYIVNIAQNSLQDINADDNGAYTNTRNTSTAFYCKEDKVYTVNKNGNELYYNQKVSYNKYKKVPVCDKEIVTLHRRYSKSKSFPMKRIIVTISDQMDGPIIPFAGVLYQTDSAITDDTPVLCHGNSKVENESRPYFRTSQELLSKTKTFLEKGISCKETYDEVNSLSGGVYKSLSQSSELRNLQQVYRQKEKLKSKVKPEDSDELIALIKYQRERNNFLRSVVCIEQSYYGFISNDTQLNDIAQFCCEDSNVLSIDTTFNLCENWLTDTCYKNLRLETVEGKHPIYLGPCILHFRKDAFTFNRFFREMCSFDRRIQMLKVIGTDQDMAIYNGFSIENPELKLLLCVYHLEKSDRHKLSQLRPKKGATNKILADIYGCQYGSVKEIGLADSTTAEDLDSRLIDLKERWENLCPDFYDWFMSKRKKLFQEKVIEEARKGSNIHGLYFNNNIESMHFKEKTEQCHKLGSSIDVIDTLKKIVDRQQDDEVRAIYGSGPYKLSRDYLKFSVDNLKWHTMTSDQRKKQVLALRNDPPSLEDQFTKPIKSGRKPCDRTRKRKPEPDVLIERLKEMEKQPAKKVRIEDPNANQIIPYQLFLRSLVPRQS